MPVQVAFGYRFRSSGTRLARPCLSGLWARMMHICDHRYRRIHTLEGPVQLVCKLNHCPDPDCPGHAQTKSPEQDSHDCPTNWAIGWDVFCWIGHRRCSARHVDSPDPIRASRRLRDQALGRCHRKYIRRYEVMLAARQQDPQALLANTNRSMNRAVNRRAATREGTRDSLCREGTHPEARVVCQTPDLRDS